MAFAVLRGFDRTDALELFGLVVLVNLIGAAPSVIAGPGTEWFAGLTKPAIYPPSAVFGIVWTALFTLQGVALWLLRRARAPPEHKRFAVALFVGSLALNVAWTPTFFGAQLITDALAVVAALTALLIPTTWSFARVDRRAGWLLVPYVAWAGFATLLTYRFLVLN